MLLPVDRKIGRDDQEYLQSFRRQVRRLDDHIRRIDAGELHARDDLAVVLRILVTDGKGEKAMKQLANRFKLRLPRRTFSPEPKRGEHVFFAVGSLPDDRGQAIIIPTELASRRCVVAKTGSDADAAFVTWDRVILWYANTEGAHLSPSIERQLAGVRVHGLGGGDLGSFMLRQIGTAISSAAHEMLAAVDPTHQTVEHSEYFGNVRLAAAIATFDGKLYDLRAEPALRDVSQGGGIISVQAPGGRVLHFGIRPDGRLFVNVAESEGA